MFMALQIEVLYATLESDLITAKAHVEGLGGNIDIEIADIQAYYTDSLSKIRSYTDTSMERATSFSISDTHYGLDASVVLEQGSLLVTKLANGEALKQIQNYVTQLSATTLLSEIDTLKLQIQTEITSQVNGLGLFDTLESIDKLQRDMMHGISFVSNVINSGVGYVYKLSGCLLIASDTNPEIDSIVNTARSIDAKIDASELGVKDAISEGIAQLKVSLDVDAKLSSSLSSIQSNPLF